MRKIARKLYRAIPFKQPAFELLRRAVRMPEPVYRHLHFEGVIDVPVGRGSFRMRHEGTQIENEVFWSGLFGRWEGASLRAWIAAARAARSILDIGANTGLYGLAAAAAAPQARVFAFEPVARIRARLEANVALNPYDITVVPAAVSDRDGEATLLDTQETHELSATLDLTGAVLAGRPRWEVRVPVVRIDSLVANGAVPPPDLAKIDVEGHEPEVLRGMENQLRDRRPTLFVEVLTERAAAELDPLLRPHGYVIHRLDSSGPHRLDRVQPAVATNLLLATATETERILAALERDPD